MEVTTEGNPVGQERTGPPYLVAALVSLATLALYALTLAPTIAFWDASEYVATAHIMGIPHPPGNPLFVTVAKVWTLLLAPTGLSVAVRVNLLAAVTSAGATGFLYLVSHRVLTEHLPGRRLPLIGSAAAALIGATAFTVWNQSNVNEKVYTISVLIIAAVSWLALRWYDTREEPGSERLLLWAGFLLVLGSTNHMMSVLPAPALGVFVLMTAPRVLLRTDFLLRAALLVVVGLSFNFVLPIRAGLDPRINEAEPACESVSEAAAAVFTMGRRGCEPLAASLTREQYQTPPVTARKAPFTAQLQNYMQYFEWQWSRGIDPSETPSTLRLPFTLLFLLLGATGLYAAWRADRAVFTYLIVLTGTLTLALVVYLNFKYGYSLAPEITDPQLHEVRERDYFFIAGFLVWGVLSGVGLAWTWQTFAKGLGDNPRRYQLTSPILAVAFIPLALNGAWATRSDDYAARDWAYDLLMSVEPYAVLFTNGDNDTFPLWYMQEVEGVRQDVTVIVGQYLQTQWYITQLQRHTDPESQRPYDADLFPGLYPERSLPSRSIITLPAEDLARVAPARLSQDFTVPFPGLAVTYPEGMVLDRNHQLALSIIHDSIDDRPIYFSASGGMLNQLGLRQWGVRHGLATKLELRPPEAPAREGWVQGSPEYGGEWFDLDHSLRLYRDVYEYRGILERDVWSDRASLNIPQQYFAMALLLSDAVSQAGGSEELFERLQADAASFQVVGQGGARGMPLQAPTP